VPPLNRSTALCTGEERVRRRRRGRANNLLVIIMCDWANVDFSKMSKIKISWAFGVSLFQKYLEK